MNLVTVGRGKNIKNATENNLKVKVKEKIALRFFLFFEIFFVIIKVQ